jgi:hypothetical protein
MMRASLGRCAEQRTDARQPPVLTRMTLSVGVARRSRRWLVRRPAEERVEQLRCDDSPRGCR